MCSTASSNIRMHTAFTQATPTRQAVARSHPASATAAGKKRTALPMKALRIARTVASSPASPLSSSARSSPESFILIPRMRLKYPTRMSGCMVSTRDRCQCTGRCPMGTPRCAAS